MEEKKSVIEEVVKKLLSQKIRLISCVLGLISMIFAVIYLVSTNSGVVMLFYVICLLLSATANVVYSVDVDEKNKYSKDILVGGTLIGLLGFVIRTVQLGILFSLHYFVAYSVFVFVFLLLAVKFTRNEGKESLLVSFLGLMAGYVIFEVIRISSMIAFVGISWSYYRISEMFLFVNYMMIVKINKSKFEEFKDGIGKYKEQIPPLKINVIIFAFVAIVSLVIGGVLELGKTNGADTVVEEMPLVVKNESKKIDEKNKAKGTVQSNSDVEIVEASAKNEIDEIALNQTILTEDFEFTINKVEFSYKVEPDNPPSWYTYYDAPEGDVYIYLNASFKNKKKQAVGCDEIYSVTVDYNNGYTYRGFNIADDTDGDFTYANITSVEPLQTLGVHCLVACPEEVEKSEKPLFLTIMFKDGSKYKYIMR